MTTSACSALTQFTQTPCVRSLDFGVQVDIYDVVTAESHVSDPQPDSVISYQPSGEVDLVTPVYQLADSSQGNLETGPMSPAALELQLAMATTLDADITDGEDDEEAYQLLPASPPRKR
jgi:hypothetical protein